MILSTPSEKNELSSMLHEDNRRQAWMEEQTLNDVQSSLEKRLNTSDVKSSTSRKKSAGSDVEKKLADMMKSNENRLSAKNADNIAAPTTIEKVQAVSPRFDPNSFTPKDPDQAFKWLQASRQFLLVDRISKTQYYFQVIKDGSSSKNYPNYVFTWKQTIHAQLFEGSIALNLCKSISLSPSDPCMFLLAIDKGPVALKTSGGRTSISIKCTNEIECGKYYASLKVLIPSGDLNENSNTSNRNTSIGASNGSKKGSELDTNNSIARSVRSNQ